MTERPGAIRNSEPPPNGALSHERGDPVNSADPWDPWVSGPQVAAADMPLKWYTRSPSHSRAGALSLRSGAPVGT